MSSKSLALLSLPILLGGCALFQKEPAIAVDSYCTAYQQVIRSPAESSITAPLTVKQRLAANEVTYRCTCTGWVSPLCKKS